MNIVVVGSSTTMDPSFVFRNTQWFEAFCEELGRWIGQRGYQLLIESHSTGTADALVPMPSRDTATATGARVKVFWRSSKAGQAPFPKHPHAEVFVEEPVAKSLLGTTHHKMLREATSASRPAAEETPTTPR